MTQEHGRSSRSHAGERGPMGDYANVSDAMMRYYLTMFESGLRYTARWSQIMTAYIPLFAEGLSRMSADGEKRGSGTALLDEYRGFLREMAELPALEARRLTQELE